MNLYHVAIVEEWNAAKTAGQYIVPSLQTEGFIHLSTNLQIKRVLDNFYAGRGDVLLLVIDEDKLAAPLQYDESVAPDGGLEHFPHLYGPLNLDAVVGINEISPNADGTFDITLA